MQIVRVDDVRYETRDPKDTLFFFNKSKLNKNIEAEIARKIRTI